VSRAIRNPETVSDAMRARVARAIQELGYVPSAPARALAHRRTGAFGILLPGFDDVDETDIVTSAGQVRKIDDRDGTHLPPSAPLYYDEVLRGAEVEAWRRGFALLVAAGRGRGDDVAGRVDGLAVFAEAMPEEQMLHIARRIPLVVLANERADAGIDSVSVDNAHGMWTVVDHVVSTLGITDIAYLAGPVDSPDDRARERGLRKALGDHGIDIADVRMRRGDFDLHRSREVTADLLAERVPRAIVCGNDQSALGALEAVRDAGLRVPHDVVVTGFDGIEAASYTTPPLTTVRQPMTSLGRHAIVMLAERLADRAAPSRHVTLSVEMLMRESCPPGWAGL
jgi:LacI family transcriptional regulator